MKIVINKCYGGFSISRATAEFMAARGNERAEKELEKGINSFGGYGYVDGMEGGYDRTDPDLVAAVEVLGDKSGGSLSDLTVVEIPDGIDYDIEEYDGIEWVAEKHQTWS